MYDLGSYFRFDLTKSMANKDCVFKGEKYRITVLTERLVRLEYNENGMFEDYPTELVWYRNFAKPLFEVNETSGILTIKTRYFELSYVKEKRFKSNKLMPTKNLKISLLNTDKTWYYGHPEVRNLKYSSYGIDKSIYKKSLYSQDGFVTIDDSKTSIVLDNGAFKKRDNAGIDMYVFLYNKDFYYCLSDYFMITGYPPLIPRAALGIWWDKKDFYNEFDIIHLVKKFEENNIPVSLFTLNRWQGSNTYEFSEFYKDPRSMIGYLKSKKMKFGLTIEPEKEFVSNTKIFEKLKAYLDVDKNGNIPFNVFDPRTIDAYLKILIHPLSNIGVDYYSIDAYNEKDLESLSILKHYLYYDKYRQGLRPLITAYDYGYASHRYPVIYSGKSQVGWNTLKKIPSYNASAFHMGLSFFSQDVGGTLGGIEDNELFSRFVELATFSPIVRLGSEGGKYYKREIWKWALKTKEISIKFLNLRHRLIPYIYTESYKYFKFGKPLIEPLYYTYPTLYDNALYKDEYYFGSTFLVSPITSKKDYVMNRAIQKLFIPEGTWYDFFTGKQYKGNKRYVSFYKDQEYPVFVKAGAIIPLSLNKSNDTSVPKHMEVIVFPGANNSYSIYEDDGETNDYLKGAYLITNIEFVYQKNNYKLTILPVEGKPRVIPEKRNYKIRFKNTKPSSSVSSYVSSSVVSNTCYKDGTDLIVEVDDVPTNAQLTITCSGEDIEIEASRIISEDVISIISDLPIKTIVKQRIDDIMFSNSLDFKKKRIEIRKLAHGKNYIERKYIDLLLKLLEYINEV